ncbi:hypothetical protein [Desmospora activa]|uniref:Glycerophosphoryl diester phosphodiesterase family protein n=1 Tax=Desmospora activa DSM 45169 TaxID=1121389 RepID=A0A2T4Z8E9_9BACL|nr:hypothetical protein [Desmospora activa]PTM58174.1 hypothetical protein C8J48_0752 [Desmospora activa DSM 45169]
MGTYFKLLRRHGLKMWAGNLLGLLATSTIVGVIGVIILAILIGIVGTSITGTLGDAFSGGDTNNIGNAFASIGVGILIVLLIGTLIFVILSTFIYSFCYAGSYAMVNEIVLDGIASIRTYFGSGFRYFGRMFLHLFLLGLVLFPFSIPAIVFEVLANIALFNGNETGRLLWGIAALVGWIFLFIVNLGAIHGPVILTAENKGAWESLKLSYRLTFKSFGKVFLTVLCIIAATITYMIFSIPMTVTSMFAENNIGLLLLTILLMGLFYLFLPFYQMAVQLIISLRYKQHLRKFVVPEEELQTDGSPYGGSFDSPSSPQSDVPQSATESAAGAAAEYEQSDTNEKEAPKNKYPQFPTDPHF